MGATARALVLDADGVVVLGVRARVAFARDFHITNDMTEGFFQGIFRDCLVGKADLKETIGPRLPLRAWRAGVDDFLAYWFSVERDLDTVVLGEVERLREAGIPCYLATNQERYRTAFMAEVLGLGRYLTESIRRRLSVT